MKRRHRNALTLLALAAMLLRAAIPAGWMPSARADAFLALCTADGLVHVLAPGAAPLDGPAAPAPHAAAPADCAFAGVAALGAPSPDFQLPLPPVRGHATPLPRAGHLVVATDAGARITRGPPA